jgi:hypothetical protein
MRHYADGNYSYRLAAHHHGVGKTVRRAFLRWSSAAPAVGLAAIFLRDKRSVR